MGKIVMSALRANRGFKCKERSGMKNRRRKRRSTLVRGSELGNRGLKGALGREGNEEERCGQKADADKRDKRIKRKRKGEMPGLLPGASLDVAEKKEEEGEHVGSRLLPNTALIRECKERGRREEEIEGGETWSQVAVALCVTREKRRKRVGPRPLLRVNLCFHAEKRGLKRERGEEEGERRESGLGFCPSLGAPPLALFLAQEREKG
ncbi:hypothetical protein AMTR_s00053p00107770 [Amborella trichopoda]|uniref:Uncharacterized protein n=1 Tax=Amborella trichopoda TaxID=13333 RepID=W1PBT1_AMBTC|nr:hypothetical protein AMTR_s00053p00107770 [Amborella trichopoda]